VRKHGKVREEGKVSEESKVSGGKVREKGTERRSNVRDGQHTAHATNAR
jgi:hypothetical protein